MNWRRYIVFLPSIGFGLASIIWLSFRPFPYERQVGLAGITLLTVLLIGGLLGGAWLLEKTLPSFRQASKLLERALGQFNITLPLAFGLAVLSSVAEELFFRGALLPLIGVWGQALLFALMHPAPRKAWSYTVFTGVAGLAFGYATLYSGSLLPAIFAHFVINLQGFLELRRKAHQQKLRQQTFSSFVPNISASSNENEEWLNADQVRDKS